MKPTNDTERIESLLSVLLRSGVTISFVLILLGTITSIIHDPTSWVSPQGIDVLLSRQTSNQTFGGILAGLHALRGSAIVTIGLLVLIATPVLRVAFSLASFVAMRDRIYVVLTAIVLSLLLLSFALGRAI